MVSLMVVQAIKDMPFECLTHALKFCLARVCLWQLPLPWSWLPPCPACQPHPPLPWPPLQPAFKLFGDILMIQLDKLDEMGDLFCLQMLEQLTVLWTKRWSIEDMEDYEPADTCWMIIDSKKDDWVDCNEFSLNVKTQSQLDLETKK